MNRTFLLVALALVLVGATHLLTSATASQKQAAEQTPRIVCAGTAVWKLGRVQDNATSVRVQLQDDIAARIGEDYIVLLTPRFTGFPYYIPYWKKAQGGFDIVLVDPSLAQGGTVSYIIPVNREFPVDWMVVRK
jgi:hypothetical protein